MKILIALTLSICLFFESLIFIRCFQLSNYSIKKYIKNLFTSNIFKIDKNRLKFTKRVKRLIFCVFLIDFLSIFLFFGWFFIIILFFIKPFFCIFSYIVMRPIEMMIQCFYIHKAQKKLKRVGCEIIAITGSFGKTSTKDILFQILSENHHVACSPQSFNTPMGICKTILNNVNENCEFLIIEMGAKHRGDIEKLCKNFGADFGILTPIGLCHLETFGSEKNIENTKFELCENAKNFVIFNCSSEKTKRLYMRFAKEKYCVNLCDSFAYAKEIEYGKFGAKFYVVCDGNLAKMRTNLLGKSNIENIVVAVAMAYLLGDNLKDITSAVEKLKPTKHRLELIQTEKFSIVDDSYNSNFDGFLTALDLISAFQGRKIVVSPGIVELGEKQYQTNFDVGLWVAKTADLFVIMNKINKSSLTAGAISGGLMQDKIYYASTRLEQKKLLSEILEQGDIVLFENDLPDDMR